VLITRPSSVVVYVASIWVAFAVATCLMMWTGHASTLSEALAVISLVGGVTLLSQQLRVPKERRGSLRVSGAGIYQRDRRIISRDDVGLALRVATSGVFLCLRSGAYVHLALETEDEASGVLRVLTAPRDVARLGVDSPLGIWLRQRTGVGPLWLSVGLPALGFGLVADGILGARPTAGPWLFVLGPALIIAGFLTGILTHSILEMGPNGIRLTWVLRSTRYEYRDILRIEPAADHVTVRLQNGRDFWIASRRWELSLRPVTSEQFVAALADRLRGARAMAVGEDPGSST
jgi:hypothetical protein